MKPIPKIALFALVLLAAVPAWASTFLAMTPRDLVTESDAVVMGEVLQVHSFWSPSGRMIVTEAIVRVEERIAGTAASVLVLRTAGGTVEGFTVEAHGFPTFEKGQRLLLFVSQGDPGEVVGYRQGQYRIVRDAAGVETAVPMLEPGVRLLSRDGRPAPRPVPVRLQELKSQIRAEAVRVGRIAN